MAEGKATFNLPNAGPIEFPIKQGSEGYDVIDISQLGKHGYFTFDPGFLSTASCESKSPIDGGKGILRIEATLSQNWRSTQLSQSVTYC